jgi:toxin YoeB
MTAARRRPAGAAPSPAVPQEARQAIVLREFREDLAWWIASDLRTALRVMRLVEEIIRTPFLGIGKPEAMKHNRQGEWSRRITAADRLLYVVHGAAVYFMGARSHYDPR